MDWRELEGPHALPQTRRGREGDDTPRLTPWTCLQRRTRASSATEQMPQVRASQPSCPVTYQEVDVS